LAVEKVTELRKYLKTICGFKKITIIESVHNLGLAKSIIDGVTQVVNTYGRIIVLEDDLITSPFFLKFLNDALEFYREENKVWHVSGWNYPYKFSSSEDVFLWRVMDCWGWATWGDRWVHFEKNSDKLIGSFSKDDIYKFNIDGNYNLWSNVLSNKKGKMNTWAVYWYASIYQEKGLCLNPVNSFVRNIGLDGTGENCGISGNFYGNDSFELNNMRDVRFVTTIQENREILEEIKLYYKKSKKSLIVRVVNKLAKITIKRNLIN